ncbi:nickel-dependent hydrogenase large subunit [Dolichospermum planctonicum]|uniref:Nickel-dependent hydrogenase large subunit n=2 Tax=Nostocales TaxID=1161 RepID=A0A480AIL9_9CYAN|nr:nickel-dependent hydrogenase large subunit [Dolichospermum planctonicum]
MVPGGVMCAPTLTDITRAWAILEYFRTNWLEPVWLGCSLERYEEIQSYEDFQKWLNEDVKHRESDLGLYWRMGLDIGLDRYGAGVGKYVTWGYIPHEDKYNKPTVEGRNAAVIMKSGVYDSFTDTHSLMNQAFARENLTHSWYDEGSQDWHPSDRTTNPINHNQKDFNGAYSWSSAVLHQDLGRLEAGPLARQLVAGGNHGESWQHYDPFILDTFKKMGGASVHVRQLGRVHEIVKLYRQAERCLREFKLNDPWYIKPEEKDGKGWGATEAARGALCHWVEIEKGKIKQYQVIAPGTWNIGPRDGAGELGPIEKALIGTPIQDPKDPVEVGHVARSFDSCLVCTVHAHDAKTGEELARFRTA